MYQTIRVMSILERFGLTNLEFRMVFPDGDAVFSTPLETYFKTPEDYPKPKTIGVYYTDPTDGLQYHLIDMDEKLFNELYEWEDRTEVYYQPVPDLDINDGELFDANGQYVFSFQVYRRKDNAQEDFPDHEIAEYRGDDIDNREYLD